MYFFPPKKLNERFSEIMLLLPCDGLVTSLWYNPPLYSRKTNISDSIAFVKTFI